MVRTSYRCPYCSHVIGYAAADQSGIRPRIAQDRLCGGINMCMPNGRHGRPDRNHADRPGCQRYTVSLPDDHSVPPDPGIYCRGEPRFGIADVWPAGCGRITISRSSDKGAVLRDPPGSGTFMNPSPVAGAVAGGQHRHGGPTSGGPVPAREEAD